MGERKLSRRKQAELNLQIILPQQAAFDNLPYWVKMNHSTEEEKENGKKIMKNFDNVIKGVGLSFMSFVEVCALYFWYHITAPTKSVNIVLYTPSVLFIAELVIVYYSQSFLRRRLRERSIADKKIGEVSKICVLFFFFNVFAIVYAIYYYF